MRGAIALLASSSLCLAACGALLGITDSLGVDPASEADGAPPVPVDSSSPPADAGPERDVTVDVRQPPRRPLEGVYAYTAAGSDRINGFVNFSFGYGPDASLTIKHVGADCFDMTLQLREKYVETMRMCVYGLELVQISGVRDQTFALNYRAVTTKTCTPGDVFTTTDAIPVDKTYPHSCVGKNKDDQSGDSTFEQKGPYKFVGITSLDVMGKDTPVLRYAESLTVTGAQTGSNIATWDFSLDEALPLKLVRTIQVRYASPVGIVTYTENLDLKLAGRPGPADAGTD